MPREKTNWANFNFEEVVAAALASNACEIADLGVNFEQIIQLIKVSSGHASWEDGDANDGPVWIGLSHSEMTAALIKTALEVRPTNARHDAQVAIATRMRNIVPLAVLGTHPAGVGETAYLDLAETKCNLQVPEGASLTLWVYNASGEDIAAGSQFRLHVRLLGRWL